MTDLKNDNLSELLELIEKHNITAYELAKHTGFSSVGIQKIIDGKTKKPSAVTIDTILDYVKDKYLLGKSYTTESVISSQDVSNYIFDKASLEDKLKLIFEQNSKIMKDYSDIKDLILNQTNENRDNKNILVEYIDMSLQPVMEFIGAKKKERENN